MTQSEPARTPSEKSSDESTQQQLQLAKEQGQAFQHAAETLIKQVAHGETRRVGDYLLAWSVEEAEGLYHRQDGHFEWEEPPDKNAHVEIIVCDGADGRFIPELDVTVTLIDPSGKELGTHRQPFLWHPWVYHYGRNWTVPREGDYQLRVRVDAPNFPRHDKKNGRRYAEPVEVTFDTVHIKPGRKVS